MAQHAACVPLFAVIPEHGQLAANRRADLQLGGRAVVPGRDGRLPRSELISGALVGRGNFRNLGVAALLPLLHLLFQHGFDILRMPLVPVETSLGLAGLGRARFGRQSAQMERLGLVAAERRGLSCQE